MAKTNPLIPLVDIQQQEQPKNTSSACLITFGTVEGTPPSGATYGDLFALECLLQDISGVGIYEMTGTVASPSWTLISSGATGDQSAIQFKDEGVNLGALGTVTSEDFVGAGVLATRVGNAVTVTIPGAGGTAGGSVYDVQDASNFAIVSGTTLTITNAGTTIRSGNTGETTKAGVAAVYGSGSDTVAVAPYATAITDSAALYTQLKALTGTAITTPSTIETNNLSGLGAGVFAPGVYTTASAIGGTAGGTVTLNGAGDYVFVSTGGAITFGDPFTIALTNGATAARVFWVANNAITSGANNILKGNFMSGVAGAITIGSTNTIEGRLISPVAVTVDGTATSFVLPAGSAGTLGDTVINGTLQVVGKFIGQLYENITGGAVTLLKMHNHLTTASIGSLEAKGEFINDTGTLYGTYVNYDYTPTSASVAPTDVEGSLSNIQLTTGKTMTAGNLVGFTGQAMNVGTLNGAGIIQVGVIGSVAGAGASTAVSHIAGVMSSVGSDVVNPSAGNLSSFVAGNMGSNVVDNTLFIQNAASTTNLLNIDATTGIVDVTQTGNGGFVSNSKGTFTAVGFIRIVVAGNTYYMPYGTVA